MKVIYELDEEKEPFEFEAHKHATETYTALLTICNSIHRRWKYADNQPEEVDDIWDELNDALLANGLNRDILGF